MTKIEQIALKKCSKLMNRAVDLYNMGKADWVYVNGLSQTMAEWAKTYMATQDFSKACDATSDYILTRI